MTRANAALIAVVACMAANVADGATMGPGPVGIYEAAACYNPFTGEIVVSVNDMVTWRVESFSGSLTGAPAVFPMVSDSLTADNDMFIAQSVFGRGFTYFDHNLGPVAAKGLPVSDLSLVYFPGDQLRNEPLTLCIPEPAGLTLLLSAAIGLLAARRPVISRGAIGLANESAL